MLECWSDDPKARPSFSDLRETFDGLLGECEGYLDFGKINEDNIYYKMPSFNSQKDVKYSGKDISNDDLEVEDKANIVSINISTNNENFIDENERKQASNLNMNNDMIEAQ